MPTNMAEPTTPARLPIRWMIWSAASSPSRYCMNPVAGLILPQILIAHSGAQASIRQEHFMQKIGARRYAGEGGGSLQFEGQGDLTERISVAQRMLIFGLGWPKLARDRDC